MAVDDGGLEFWSALAEVCPETRAQRCWVHKAANVLDNPSKRIQGEAKSMLHEIWGSDTRARAQVVPFILPPAYDKLLGYAPILVCGRIFIGPRTPIRPSS